MTSHLKLCNTAYLSIDLNASILIKNKLSLCRTATTCEIALYLSIYYFCKIQTTTVFQCNIV